MIYEEEIVDASNEELNIVEEREGVIGGVREETDNSDFSNTEEDVIIIDWLEWTSSILSFIPLIFFRLEAIILRTFFERRSIVIFLTLNMFLPTG